ncbi:ferrochelatase [Neisseria gonorrhoeae]|uniref:Ferrochelatase n=1 Tax=Neisseria gonorrhoeae TaxID=485 RepID=A0A378W1C7_NEIGO|nr:ferrochelatase [Neisseria gonorrhoeae]
MGYTEHAGFVRQTAQTGVTELDVFCPGFLADCLETMEEIALMGREQFYEAGGKTTATSPASTTTPTG